MNFSFAAFLETEIAKAILNDEEARTRLLKAAGTITTLPDMIKWGKERYPDRFHDDPRKTFGMRGVLNKLWAAYLGWKEEATA